MNFQSEPQSPEQFSASDRKLFASLSSAKGRREAGLFMAQGTKCVLDTLGHFPLRALLATRSWADSHLVTEKVTVVKQKDIERITTLSTAPEVIAVYRLPAPGEPDLSGLVLALDCVQDPGNLGTIMRVADWMGVHTILASHDTADCFSPKVVQATMGAISRVKVHYCSLPDVLSVKSGVYGTFLDGEDIYSASLPGEGIIVMGNEGKGISPEVASTVTGRLRIPSYPPGEPTSESLNVAVAAALTLAEFRRRQLAGGISQTSKPSC